MDDLGSGKTTKCLERMRYERDAADPRPSMAKLKDPGPCDWGTMSDEEIEVADKSRCVYHAKQRADDLRSKLDGLTGGRNLN